MQSRRLGLNSRQHCGQTRGRSPDALGVAAHAVLEPRHSDTRRLRPEIERR
jgi:hypothetical protein